MAFKIFRSLGVLAALALAGCAGQTPGPGETASRRVEPASRLETQAIAFEAYMRNARRIDPGFSGPGAVSESLQTAAAHETSQLEAGMIAYAALAALQEPSFVAGVQRAGRDGALARELEADPGRAAALPGGAAAAGRASAALATQGESLAEQGARVKRAAYTTQHQAWARGRVRDPAGRLARVKRLSEIAYSPQPGDAAQLRQAVAEAGRRGGTATPVVARGLAVAALSVLGQEGRAHALMSEPRTGGCLHLAKLNLYQCLASSGAEYEDIFCLGQHAMADTGECVAEAARAPAGRHVYASEASWRR